MVERRADELDNDSCQYRQENDQFRTQRVVMDLRIRELEPTFGVLKNYGRTMERMLRLIKKDQEIVGLTRTIAALQR